MKRSLIGALAALAAIATVALAASCSSLPHVNPDLAGPTTPVLLEGPGRPLSAAQGQAILARLAAGDKETSIFERHH